MSEADWRLTGQEKYLRGVTLVWRRYSRYSPDWDHDHCAFCWAKFIEPPAEDCLREGYCTEDAYHWVCADCFADFRDRFEWVVLKESEGAG